MKAARSPAQVVWPLQQVVLAAGLASPSGGANVPANYTHAGAGGYNLARNWITRLGGGGGGCNGNGDLHMHMQISPSAAGPKEVRMVYRGEEF